MNGSDEETLQGEDVARMMVAWSQSASAFCRRVAGTTGSAAVRDRLIAMSEAHKEHARVLEELVKDEDARSEITNQINDLFRGEGAGA
jgi:hypothetical protein